MYRAPADLIPCGSGPKALGEDSGRCARAPVDLGRALGVQNLRACGRFGDWACRVLEPESVLYIGRPEALNLWAFGGQGGQNPRASARLVDRASRILGPVNVRRTGLPESSNLWAFGGQGGQNP